MTSNFNLTRRSTILGGVSLSALALSGCDETYVGSEAPDPTVLYRAMPEERFPVPAIDPSKVHPGYYRTVVKDPTGLEPGTIYVDTKNYYLYLVAEDQLAMRYGVGLGKAGFGWSGEAVIGYKREWPRWFPPKEMIAREPHLEKYSFENGGMPPGLKNPLGARALYIYQDGVDTLYRLHSSSEVYSIGRAVSSGCVRMLHQDVIDLYNRVNVGAKIIVA